MVDLEGAGTKCPPFGLGCIWEGMDGRVKLFNEPSIVYAYVNVVFSSAWLLKMCWEITRMEIDPLANS